MPNEHTPRTIVIGAGIAGLTAACTLAKAGVRVKVLEASSRVGGRMSTDVLNGFVVDRGAQFLSSEYALLLSLATEHGLKSSIQETSPWSAIVRGGTIRQLRADRPLHVLTSGLLGLPAWMRFAWRTWQLRRPLRALSLSDYSQWASFDNESVSSWVKRSVDPSVNEYVFEPMLQGFYFQRPEDTSLALSMALSAFGFRRARTLACSGGIGTLPEAMASRLDVLIDSPVCGLEVGVDSVTVITATSRLEADHVVLAVPAPEARRLYAGINETTRRLMATPYSSTIKIAVMTDDTFQLPANLAAVYGLLIPRLERTRIAAVGIETNKYRVCAPQGQLLNIMLSDTAAQSMLALPDDAIIQLVLPEAETFFPGLSENIDATRIYRWPQAEPCSDVGRATDLRQYRANCGSSLPRVLLAGDYMSMPYTEGAAESGKWAAEQICLAAFDRAAQ